MARVACGFSLTALVAALLGVAAAGQSSAGAIRGHIVLTGKPPGNPFIRMGVDPNMFRAQRGSSSDSRISHGDGGRERRQRVCETGGTFPKTAVPTEPVVIEQRACVYRRG